MCMFSRHVEHVSATKIFARGLADGRQVLVYAMDFAAAEDLAMILPLPVPADGPDDAVEFVDLGGYATFFDDVKRAFPMLVPMPQAFGRGAPPAKRLATLEVHRVGAFEASFVPHPRDFARLDARFRFAPDVLAALPYADWGFAVFQLRSGKKSEVHPMALRFPRREPGALFFPTVHVHDGKLPATAAFDHSLYTQLSPVLQAVVAWTPSIASLGSTVDAARARDLVDPAGGGHALAIHGAQPNRDVWLRPPAGITEADLAGRAATYAYQIRAIYHFATQSHHQYPHWLDTAANRLPALCAGVRAGLAELTAKHARAWQLGPLHDDLPPHFMNGALLTGGTGWNAAAPTSTSGPARVTFAPFTDRIEPQHITLGFTEVPTREDASEIQQALRAMLDRAL